MTESEWFTCCKVTQPLLDWLRKRGGSDRKFHLAGCAAVRHVWEAIDDPLGRVVVDLVERYIEGDVNEDELSGAASRLERSVSARVERLQFNGAGLAQATRPFAATIAASHLARTAGWQAGVSAMFEAARVGKRAEQHNWQTIMLRDLFGNPFKPMIVEQAWLDWHDRTVVKLAEAAYQERLLPAGHLDKGRLAILADALDEAGCTDRFLLGHLRAAGCHVRGCWVVDLLLGKE